jgi:murein DD-endopeptidase MepM/ murein hydrolase activator NlpD
MAETCGTCGRDLSQRAVPVSGEDSSQHSETSLRLRMLQLARSTLWRRYALSLLALAIAASVAWSSRPRPKAMAIVSVPPLESTPTQPRPRPFGPPWPPTEADWLREFAQSSWTYPMPGPARSVPVSCSRLFDPRADCSKGLCAADFATEVWGQHVFAVHDGVVDRVIRSGNEEHGGSYVRLSHWGGMVYTQYFHLAAVARGVLPGVHIKAGDVIGLVGDTGVKDARMVLHFTLSVRPSYEYPEVYMDPLPLLAKWPVRSEPQGSVVGLISGSMPAAQSHLLLPLARRHPHPTRKRTPAAPAASEPTESESTDSPD